MAQPLLRRLVSVLTGVQELKTAEATEVAVSRTQRCAVFLGKGGKRRVGDKRPADLGIDHLCLEDLPEPFTRLEDHYVGTTQPRLDDPAGIST